MIRIIFALIGAAAIIGTALWSVGTPYEKNAWLYVFSAWLVLNSILEVYLSKKKDNDH
jgi:hypothetical protein